MKEIKLIGGGEVIVDDIDYDALSRFKWRISRWTSDSHPYAYTSINGRSVLMHRYILTELMKVALDGLCADHVNGDTLDCTRKNLRPATRSQNRANSKITKRKMMYRGITKLGGRYFCQTIGLRKPFKTELEAGIAFNIEAYKKHGRFAVLNKIEGFDTHDKVCDYLLNQLIKETNELHEFLIREIDLTTCDDM